MGICRLPIYPMGKWRHGEVPFLDQYCESEVEAPLNTGNLVSELMFVTSMLKLPSAVGNRDKE